MADVEKGTSSGMYAAARPCDLAPTNFTHQEDGHLDQPLSQEGCRFGNSSGPLFSMYSKIVEKDDNALAERWQKDADGIIIFVSAQVRFYAIACINRKSIGGFILCSYLHIPLNIDSGPESQLTRYFRFLPQEYLPISC
jgi:hypothetical protein